MNVFEAVRGNIKAIDVISMVGLHPTRSNMICCPFHNDKHPSMKVDQCYFCFGCGAKGDAIDFISNYYGIGLKDAAEKIASHFSLPYDKKGYTRNRNTVPTAIRNEYKIWAEKKRMLFARLSTVHGLLQNIKTKYAPKDMEDSEWSPLFAFAVNELNRLDDLYDYCLFHATDEELQSEYEEITKEIEEIEKRVNDTEYGISRSDVGQIGEGMAV